MPSAYWESVLIDSLIRFSPPSVFNDPFEMQPFYESLALDPRVKKQLTSNNAESALIEELEKAIPNVPPEIASLVTENWDFVKQFAHIIAPDTVEMSPLILGRITQEISNGIYTGLDQNVGVLSLSEKKDDLLMWAHYADQHKGLVLGFDVTNAFFDQRLQPDDDFRHLRHVVYTETRPTIKFVDDNEMSVILLTKSLEWRYERELRMLLPLVDADKEIDVFGEKISLFKFPPTCLRQIILGYRMPSNLKESILEYVKNDKRYGHVQLFTSTLDSQEFKLQIIAL